MSYLGYPRIHFAGRFQADVSTVNNLTQHYDNARFLARYQRLLNNAPDPTGDDQTNWNPRGTGAWRFRDCRVTSVLSADGIDAPDPATTAVLAPADDRVSAKLVDLDPEQQMVSEIFGMRLALRFPGGGTGFVGDFEVAPFSDLWVRAPGPPENATFGAIYQSVIAVDQWGDDPDSPVLQQLREASDDGLLSIRFNLDGQDSDITSPTFPWGRVVGSIGPYLAGEPHHFVAARVWAPPNAQFPFVAPFRLDEATSTLFADLGNALPTTEPGGPLQDLGQLQIVATPSDGAPVFLGFVEPGDQTLYERHAGIVAVKLDPTQLAAARETPLALVDGQGNTLLAERSDGTYLRADDFVFRLDPGDTATTTIHAARFGQPAASVEVDVWHDDSGAQPLPGDPPVGVPPSALTFPASVTTGADGTAELTLTASDPGNPRGYIDGQTYGVAYGWGHDASVAVGNMLAALVFDEHAGPPSPTWVADVQPILQQYANLYPAMAAVVDLSDYNDVVRHKRALELAMGLPITDPNYMPVTRDLSRGKREMVLRWLQQPEPEVFRIDDVASLRQVLQLAVELEHATIPPYLCALWSIVPGRNAEVADLIQSVVMEEMLHFALACNLLNAVGGHPDIQSPAFVPKYPGRLPGGVRPDLTVSLRKCSKEHIRDVFMSIEEPGETIFPEAVDLDPLIDTRPVEVDENGMVTNGAEVAEQVERHFRLVEHHRLTIGWFYKQIGKAIAELSESEDIFTGDPSLQMTPEVYTGAPGRVYRIHDKTSALLALHEIERQGEGTSGTDPVGGRHELAHFYRFQEIVEGRQMVETSPGKWAFEGPPIPFDPTGVMPMRDDPDTSSLHPGTQVRATADVFEGIYGDLLRSLHATFNGSPETLGPAVGLMFSCKAQAQKLLAMPIAADSGETAGPSFQPA